MKKSNINWDLFFYYGEGDLNNEIKQDILNGVTTSKNKLFFNRADSAGVNNFINSPNSLAIEIGLKYSIVKWLAYRNTYIGNGQNNSKERRIAISQNNIKINQKNSNVDIDIFYIPFFNKNTFVTIEIPFGSL